MKNQNKKINSLIIQNSQSQLQNEQINEIIKTQKNESDQLKQIMDICINLAKTNSLVADTINIQNNTTNSHNKLKQKFNLNFFLNEQCKDAINLIDFVRGIKLELKDMVLHNKLGYVDAITHIFNTELQKTELTKRPIHCTDLKRETIYVRNDNVWQNDDNKLISENAIEALSNRNYKQMKQWKEENPDFLSCPNKNKEYLMLTMNLMGGSTDHEQNSNAKKIIKNIAKCAHLDKQEAITIV